MLLHMVNNYHFTEDNILSLLEQLNNSWVSTLGNIMFVYNRKGDILCEYRYFKNQNWYPDIYIYDQNYIFNRDTNYNQIKLSIPDFVKDLLSNKVYKITQNFSKPVDGWDYDDIIEAVHIWVE